MEIKVSKTREGVALSGALPPEIAFAESIEVFPLRDGAFLLTVKGFVEKAKEGTLGITLSAPEIEVIRKLSAVRFERRVPSEIRGMLSQQEMSVLEGLARRKIINIFHSEKYGKEGVYNIVDDVYPIVRSAQAQEGAAAPRHAEQKAVSTPATRAQATPGAQSPPALPDTLAKKGYMVLDNENDARRFSDSYSSLVKNGDVAGIRAFDRKYYFVSKAYLEKFEKRLLASLAKGDKNADELSGELGAEGDGCRALLYNMCESGDVIEKQKGKFARA